MGQFNNLKICDWCCDKVRVPMGSDKPFTIIGRAQYVFCTKFCEDKMKCYDRGICPKCGRRSLHKHGKPPVGRDLSSDGTFPKLTRPRKYKTYKEKVCEYCFPVTYKPPKICANCGDAAISYRFGPDLINYFCSRKCYTEWKLNAKLKEAEKK